MSPKESIADYVRLGHALRVARHLRELTQQQLGDLVGLTRSQISTLEGANEQAPVWTLELILRLTRHLHIHPDAFTHGPGNASRVLRGRVAVHMSHLGRWERISEAVHYILDDFHKIRPDVVGLSVLLGAHPLGGTRVYTAELDRGFSEVEVKPADEQYQRWRDLRERARESNGGLNPHNLLTSKDVRLPPHSKAIFEWTNAGIGLQVALFDYRGMDDHLELLLLHFGMEMSEQFEMRWADFSELAQLRRDLTQLSERVRRIES